MTIATATAAKAIAARDAVAKALTDLQQYAQGSVSPSTASAAQVTATDTLIDAAVVALIAAGATKPA